MQILADESTPFILVQHIKNIGVRVFTAKEKGLRGKPDEEVLEFAVEHKLIILTSGLDFGNILLYPPTSHLVVIDKNKYRVRKYL